MTLSINTTSDFGENRIKGISNYLLWCVVTLFSDNRQISQMMYQPKSVGKIAAFETLTLCIYLNSGQMSTSP